MRRFLLGMLAVVVIVVPGLAGAQQTKHAGGKAQLQPGQEVPLFRTQSNLVLVDVVVTKHGKPVLGLGKSEFQVFEDGKPQRVTIFEQHKATDAVQVAEAPENLPEGMYSNQPQYKVDSAADVILLDGLNTPMGDQVYLRTRMLNYLKSIPKGTEVAVFTLTTRLEMVQGFNGSRQVLEAALKEAESHPQKSAVMSANYSAGMNLLTDMAQGGGSQGTALAAIQQFQSDQEAFMGYMRVRMTISAMDQLGRYLSTIPGRKNLIWFSGDVPPIVAGGGERMGQASEGEDYQDLIRKMDSLLTLARVAVYPVDVRGLIQSKNFTAEAMPLNPQMMNSATMGPGGGTGIGGQQTMGQRLVQQNKSARDLITEEQNTMWQIAKETGGKAYVNTNAVGKALPAAIANGSDYYTIGYVPENRNYNGAYRKIRVKLEEGRDQLQYRRGYYALDPAKQKGLIHGEMNPLIAAMQPGAPNLSQVLFRARVVPAGAPGVKKALGTADSGGKMAAQLKNPQRYVVDYWINPKTLKMTALPDGRRQAKVELTEVVFNRMGIRQNYMDTALEVNLSPADVAKAMEDGVHLQQQIDLPEGQSLLRVGVRDIDGGQIGTLEALVRAGGHSAGS